MVALVGLVEAAGVYFALGDICEREVTEKDIAKVVVLKELRSFLVVCLIHSRIQLFHKT